MSSVRRKVILYAVFSLLILAFSIFVWAERTGKINLFADTEMSTVNIKTVTDWQSRFYLDATSNFIGYGDPFKNSTPYNAFNHLDEGIYLKTPILGPSPSYNNSTAVWLSKAISTETSNWSEFSLKSLTYALGPSGDQLARLYTGNARNYVKISVLPESAGSPSLSNYKKYAWQDVMTYPKCQMYINGVYNTNYQTCVQALGSQPTSLSDTAGIINFAQTKNTVVNPIAANFPKGRVYVKVELGGAEAVRVSSLALNFAREYTPITDVAMTVNKGCDGQNTKVKLSWAGTGGGYTVTKTCGTISQTAAVTTNNDTTAGKVYFNMYQTPGQTCNYVINTSTKRFYANNVSSIECPVTPVTTATTTSTTSTTSSSTTTTTTTDTNTPQAPLNLTATAVDHDTVRLNWDEVSGAQYYYVYSSQSSNIPMAVVEDNTYTINGLTCAQEYSYFVRSVRVVNNTVYISQPSNTASATTAQCPQQDGNDISDKKVEGLDGKIVDKTNIDLTWNPLEGAYAYDIYSCDGAYIGTTQDTNYRVSGLLCGHTYCFQVYARAYEEDCEGSSCRPIYSLPSDQKSFTLEQCELVVNQAENVNNNANANDNSALQNIGNLVSTGSSIWANVLIALGLIIGVGYFLFHKEIWKN